VSYSANGPAVFRIQTAELPDNTRKRIHF